jgi:hypothetical protein
VFDVGCWLLDVPGSAWFMAPMQVAANEEASHEPGNDRDGPLSLSLSPSEGERVPKAGERAVHGPDARQMDMEALCMNTASQEIQSRCHDCSSPNLRLAKDFDQAWRVTSDCKPWPPGGSRPKSSLEGPP